MMLPCIQNVMNALVAVGLPCLPDKPTWFWNLLIWKLWSALAKIFKRTYLFNANKEHAKNKHILQVVQGEKGRHNLQNLFLQLLPSPGKIYLVSRKWFSFILTVACYSSSSSFSFWLELCNYLTSITSVAIVCILLKTGRKKKII